MVSVLEKNPHTPPFFFLIKKVYNYDFSVGQLYYVIFVIVLSYVRML